MSTPFIKAGEKNDPSVEVHFGGGLEACTPQFREVMRLLGFKEDITGSFVYHAGGRAIWVNPKSPDLTEDVTKQIIDQAEAIGRRAKINELRKCLDIPFGEISELEVVKVNRE